MKLNCRYSDLSFLPIRFFLNISETFDVKEKPLFTVFQIWAHSCTTRITFRYFHSVIAPQCVKAAPKVKHNIIIIWHTGRTEKSGHITSYRPQFCADIKLWVGEKSWKWIKSYQFSEPVFPHSLQLKVLKILLLMLVTLVNIFGMEDWTPDSNNLDYLSSSSSPLVLLFLFGCRRTMSRCCLMPSHLKLWYFCNDLGSRWPVWLETDESTSCRIWYPDSNKIEANVTCKPCVVTHPLVPEPSIPSALKCFLEEIKKLILPSGWF